MQVAVKRVDGKFEGEHCVIAVPHLIFYFLYYFTSENIITLERCNSLTQNVKKCHAFLLGDKSVTPTVSPLFSK